MINAKLPLLVTTKPWGGIIGARRQMEYEFEIRALHPMIRYVQQPECVAGLRHHYWLDLGCNRLLADTCVQREFMLITPEIAKIKLDEHDLRYA